MNILLLEPDKVLARNLSALLKFGGHKTTASCDAQQAIVLADSQKPDLIITELMLAGRSGVEFLYELRSYPDWQQIPVVIYSSVPPSEALVASSCFDQLEIKHFFYKPTTDLNDLAATVNGLALVAA